MTAPTFKRPIQGTGANQFVSAEADQAALNAIIEALWQHSINVSGELGTFSTVQAGLDDPSQPLVWRVPSADVNSIFDYYQRDGASALPLGSLSSSVGLGIIQQAVEAERQLAQQAASQAAGERQLAQSAAALAAEEASGLIAPSIAEAESAAMTAGNEADRAEAARDATGLLAGSAGYQPDVATAENELSDDDVFWTVEGEEIVQYQIISGAGVEIEGARMKASSFFADMRRGFFPLLNAVSDADGFLLSGYSESGDFVVGALRASLDGPVTAAADHPVFSVLTRDLDGIILQGITNSGQVLPQGGAALPQEAPVVAHYWIGDVS